MMCKYDYGLGQIKVGKFKFHSSEMFSRILSCFIIIFGLSANCIDAWVSEFHNISLFSVFQTAILISLTSMQRPFKFNFTSIEVVDNPKIFKANGAIRLNSAGHTVVDYYYEPQQKLLGPILVSTFDIRIE